MKRILILAAVAVLTVGALGTVSASDDHSERKDVKAKLSGFGEVPSISTTGSGRLRLRVDSAGTTITYELSYLGLEGGAVTGAHLHFGQPGVNGEIIADLCGGTKPACPASPTVTPITGSINNLNILGPSAQGIAAGEFAEVLRAIRAGAVYVNVHTALYPTGEIRGQLKGGKS
jgi:hypothetical protein